jgi:hypothetical protein
MHLFNVLKGKFSGKELNLFRNWLKHATGPDKIAERVPLRTRAMALLAVRDGQMP